jgi:hypothetical protein
MIRVLVIIAVTGFLVSVVSIASAVAIVGPEAIADGAWSWRPDSGWNFGRDGEGWGFHHHRHDRDSEDNGARSTREIAWTGGDSVDFDLPADVIYTQAPGPAKLVVTGDKGDVADVVIDDGHVRFSEDRHRDADVTITMTAPSVSHFTLSGRGKLAIVGYKQDKLSVDLPGDADVVAKGETGAVDLAISGSGNADLGGLNTRSAVVNIEGSGQATLAPVEAARIDISGSGDVTLLTHPPRLESHITGSGDIVQGEERPAASSAPATGTRSKKGARA